MLKQVSAAKVEIGGHTDNVGAADTNLALSQKRAESVRAALVERGIPTSRLAAKGYGDTAPVADNRSEEGRAKNRRVELVKQ
jgi:outer membrane protein OmpA-like peptidoglycan-associated protein